MTPWSEDDRAVDGGQGQFTTTRWSVVMQARQEDSSQAAAALEQLCRTYWYPLYAHARRHGRGPEDAEDLIQGFFPQLLQSKALRHLDRSKGLFWSLLLGRPQEQCRSPLADNPFIERRKHARPGYDGSITPT